MNTFYNMTTLFFVSKLWMLKRICNASDRRWKPNSFFKAKENMFSNQSKSNFSYLICAQLSLIFTMIQIWKHTEEKFEKFSHK